MLQVEALEILKTGANIFLTGVPGAGKTYVVNKYVEWLKDKGIYPAITASTGIAATHIGGRTIHSFVGLGVVDYLDEQVVDKIMQREKLYKKILNTQVLVIDEISMLDAKVLDKVNAILKGVKNNPKPFGGIQVIFVGDFFQLPPVQKRNEEQKYFAFMGTAWREAKPLTCYLEEQYRQTDETFTKLLLAIRENNVEEMHIEILEELKAKAHMKLGIPLPKGEGLGVGVFEEVEINYETPNPGPSPKEKGESAIQVRPYNSKLIDVARQNRQNLTESEQKFWEIVRDHKIGFEFQRQKPINNFILDFYCKELNLAIEVDGGYHDKSSEVARDNERTKILNSLGIKVLRLKNDEVNNITSTELFLKINSVGEAPLHLGEGSGVGVNEEEERGGCSIGVPKDSEVATDNILELHSHNKNVDEINNTKLNLLKGKEFIYKMETFGRASLVEGLIKSCLSPEILKLKKGAKVIFTKNDIEGKYVNGTMGVVADLDDEGIVVETKANKLIECKKEEWAIEEDGKVKARIMQYPLRLAWAITVHKSQGMSLDEAIVNLGDTFEYGQGYVALSRVRSLEGLYLKSYNAKSLRVSEHISEFDEKIRKDSRFIQEKFQNADKKKLEETQKKFISKCGGVPEGGVEKTVEGERRETQVITLDYIKEGKTLEEIAVLRDIGIRTLYKHLEDLFKHEKLNKLELSKIIKKELNVDIYNIPTAVEKSFKKHKNQVDEDGNIKLAPVFKDLKEKYSYEVLRFYRLFV
jgi:very-short-patch-repair endonuclease/nucleoside-triphosphatase THEP1